MVHFKKELIYLALPFSSSCPEVKKKRVDTMMRLDILFMTNGIHTVSPVYKQFVKEVDVKEIVPSTWDFWKSYSEELMSRCDKLYVLCFDGWKESEGVRGEIEMAKNLSIPITYFYLSGSDDSF